MRITQKFIFNNFLDNINKNRSESAEIQNRLITGKRVNKASDDIIAFSQSRSIRQTAFKEEQYQSNVVSGLAQARQVQESMDTVIDLLIELKQTAIEGSNDSQSASERVNLAGRVDSLRELMLNELNTDYNGVHLFGGTVTDAAPFTEDVTGVGGILDTSNDTRLSIQASDATSIEYSVTGTELRNAPGGDMFQIIQDLETAFTINDQTGINASIDLINDALDHVIGLASEQGNSINRLDFLDNQYEKRMIANESRISELVDADYAETVALFQQYHTAYEAALAVHSESARTSLLNFL